MRTHLVAGRIWPNQDGGALPLMLRGHPRGRLVMGIYVGSRIDDDGWGGGCAVAARPNVAFGGIVVFGCQRQWDYFSYV